MLLDTPTPSASDTATITPSQELAENIAAWTKPPARNSHRSAYSDDVGTLGAQRDVEEIGYLLGSEATGYRSAQV